jgi:hypothetical protein
MNIILAEFNAAELAMILAALMTVAWGFGLWVGKQRLTRYGDSVTSQWYGAVLSLLSLLLAFTVNASMGMHNERQRMVVADSNAIRNFYVSATMLDEPAKSKLQSLIRQYVKQRIDLSRLSGQASEFENGLQQSNQLVEQMNQLVAQVVKSDAPFPAALSRNLDGIANSSEARLVAGGNHLPPSMLLLLMSSAVVATLLVGCGDGASGRTYVLGAVGFIFLVSFTVYVILDLNQPTRGRITVSQEPIERLLSSMPE